MSRPRTSTIAAGLVIVGAGALAVLWAFLIPIFQDDDEPAHFDYAESIAQAHRLVRRADGASATLVTPVARYLIGASDFARIAGHSPMHVPRGYGTGAYYKALDSKAPRIEAAKPPDRFVSYIVRLYPFGFYGAEALVIGAASMTGSVSVAFFAARLFCVVLLMISLYFNFRTARELDVPSPIAVILTAAVGVFPLTSLMSSYVQPDNLAYTALSAAIFFASRFRRVAVRPSSLVPLGTALGVLAVTKYQFFLSAMVPAALLITVALLRQKSRAVAVLACATSFVAPAAVLLSVQHWFVDGGTALNRSAPSDIGVSYIAAVAAGGLGTLVHYVIGSLTQAFWGCFVSGICSAGYWGVVGWNDTPIVIGNFTTETLIRIVISAASICTAVIVLYYCACNGARLIRAALRGHALRAAWIFSSQIVVNSYMAFVAIIFALYVATNNVFGLSGRHWYPYIFIAFLFFAWYAPRAIFARWRTVSFTLACVLLLYSLLAAGYALRGILQRYYGPDQGRYVTSSVIPSPGTTPGQMWPLQDAIYFFAPAHQSFGFVRGRPVEARGTALQESGIGAEPVAIVLDDRQPVPVLPRQYLFSIAEGAHSIAAGYSGFSAAIDTTRLAYGAHTLSAYARSAPTQPYRIVPPARLFFVTTQDGGLPLGTLRSLQRVPTNAGTLLALQICRGASNRGAFYAGTVVLARLTLPSAAAHRYESAWLLARDHPYAAAFEGDSVVAKIPTAELGIGDVEASMFASGRSASSAVSLARFALHIVPANAKTPLETSTAPECSDPLGLLASG